MSHFNFQHRISLTHPFCLKDELKIRREVVNRLEKKKWVIVIIWKERISSQVGNADLMVISVIRLIVISQLCGSITYEINLHFPSRHNLCKYKTFKQVILQFFRNHNKITALINSHNFHTYYDYPYIHTSALSRTFSSIWHPSIFCSLYIWQGIGLHT